MAKPPQRRPQGAVPSANERQVVKTTETRIQTGPLPVPEDLAGYDRLVPGSAERIIAMAEGNQQHRIAMERQAQAADIAHREELVRQQSLNARAAFRSDLAGQLLGAAIALTAVGGAIYLAAVGAPWYVVASFISLPLAAIIRAIRDHARSKADKK